MEEHDSAPPRDGIAIIGMAGRFPGADNVDRFWENLVNGVESIAIFKDEELEYSVSTEEGKARGQKFVSARAILDDVAGFDAEFFGMYPKEAQVTDPQHRLFLECAWETLEAAGHAPDTYTGLTGVYAGLGMNTYLLHNLCSDRNFAANFAGNYQVGVYQIMLGNDKDFLPTRVSYKLNLRGPSMTIQTACSTSLVAICQACTALMTYQCDTALAGGVSITFPQKRNYLYQEEAMVSADGTCRSFDAEACGTVFGHGVAVVLLKRLDDAIANGDNVLAVIKGTAINNDGSDKIGYAAPGVKAQADVIAMAQAAAGVDPETISYVEAHGTATPLGDPIEVAALTDAFRRGGSTRQQYCALGTGKTNIGHLDIAAGATGLIKTVLQLQHEVIPPLLHFKAPNPRIDFANSPFYPVSKQVDWKRGTEPRRAGVSAFGVGGTNSHVVLEESPLLAPSGKSRRRQLMILSAKTETALRNMSERLATYLECHSDIPLADVAFTLQKGRQRFRHRRTLSAGNAKEAIDRLRDANAAVSVSGAPTRLAFLFPGQGSQYVNMGRELYETEAEFREAVDLCASYLHGHLGFDIRLVLYPSTEDSARKEAEIRIHETRITQPAIFVVEYALARLWMSWGIMPSLLIGHSVGEYVVAVLAGVFTLEEALGLLASRAKLMQDLPAGSMLAVRGDASRLDDVLSDDVSIAAVNSGSHITLSGPTATLNALQGVLEDRKIACRPLSTSHAFHSAMMDPIVAPFTNLVVQIKQNAPKLPWVSSLTASLMNSSPEPSYWARQLRETVQFAKAVDTATQLGATVFLEVGPGQALTQLVRQHPSFKSGGLFSVASLSANDARPADLDTLLNSLGRLWMLGIEPDWDSFYTAEKRCRVPLPTYPFERKPYWIEPVSQERSGKPAIADIQSDTSLNERTATLNGNGHAPASFPIAPSVTTPLILEDGRPNTHRLIERQIRLMAQQIEMLRGRGAARELQNNDIQ